MSDDNPIWGCRPTKLFPELYPDRPHSHTNDPQTSFDAGDKMVRSGELNCQEQAVWEAMRKATDNMTDCLSPNHCNFTAKELSNWSGLSYFIIQRRISGLIDKGKVEFLLQDGTWTKYPKGKKLQARDGCRIMRAI